MLTHLQRRNGGEYNGGMAKKKQRAVTLDNLAGMVKNGFDAVDDQFRTVEKRFEAVDKKFELLGKNLGGKLDEVSGRVVSVALRLEGHIDQTEEQQEEFEELKSRVNRLEDTVFVK